MSIYIEAMKAKGTADALELRARAKDMDGTAIIAEEEKIPDWEKKDYSAYPVGSPVADDGQVWTLLQPYDATVHTAQPKDLRAMWGLCHTKDPLKAKAWVDPYGTSGMYMVDECYTDGEKVYRCLVEQTNFDAKAMPTQWEVVM